MRNESFYAIGALCQKAVDGAFGADNHRAGGALHVIGLGYFPVLLQQNIVYPMLGDLNAVLLGALLAYERDRELLSVLLLPAGNLWQELSAGGAVGIGEDQHYGLAGRTQEVEGDLFTTKILEPEGGGRRANRQPGRRLASVLRRNRRRQARRGESLLHRAQPRQQPPVLPEQGEQEPPLGAKQPQYYQATNEVQELHGR
jgi:hypothetical protein